MWVLCFRDRLLASLWPGYRELLASWKTILRMGLPVAVSNAIIPVALGLLTRIVTGFGAEAVAGFGVATRIEGFGLSLIYALSTGISPFVGQNFGAGRLDRIKRGLFLSKMFCLAWGGLLFVVFLLFGKLLAAQFDGNSQVTEVGDACTCGWCRSAWACAACTISSGRR